jgi:hypothetical protein
MRNMDIKVIAVDKKRSSKKKFIMLKAERNLLLYAIHLQQQCAVTLVLSVGTNRPNPTETVLWV